MNATKETMKRFRAVWIAKQYAAENGEHDPDCDEFGVSYHPTKEEAESSAIHNSKAANQCEWILVAEEVYIGHEWVDQFRWSGDWDGLADVTFSAEMESSI